MVLISVRLIYSFSLVHNIISNCTGVNAHFFIALKIISQIYMIISENKKETFCSSWHEIILLQRETVMEVKIWRNTRFSDCSEKSCKEFLRKYKLLKHLWIQKKMMKNIQDDEGSAGEL